MVSAKQIMKRGVVIPLASLFLYWAVGLVSVVAIGVDHVVEATIVADIGMSGICFLIMRRWLQSDAVRAAETLSMQKVVLLLVLGVIMAEIASQVLSTAIFYYTSDTSFESYSTKMESANVWLMLLLAVVVAPVCEEFLFRGVVFKSLTFCSSPLAAAIVSSVVFALWHGTVTHIPLTFAVGMFASALYWQTGKLWASMLLHGVLNASSFLWNGVSVNIDPVNLVGWFVLWAIAISVAVVVLMLGKNNRQPEEKISD